MPASKKKHTQRSHHPPEPPDKTDQRRIESKNEDSKLIRLALKGDQSSFARLRQKYHDAIYNLIYRMIREKDEVEDLTQEAFIKAFASLASFNDEYAFSTWLYKIATNNCIDYIRRKKLHTFSIDKPIESKESDFSFELPDSSNEPDQEMIATQRRKLLEDAINSLPKIPPGNCHAAPGRARISGNCPDFEASAGHRKGPYFQGTGNALQVPA